MRLENAVAITVLLLAAPAWVAAQEPDATPAPAAAPAAVEEPAPPAGPEAAWQAIDRGLRAYWRHRFAAAAQEFQVAFDADPRSAAAAFYLGYAIYKQHELQPFHPDKQRAKEMFARAFELDPEFRPDFKPRR